MNTIERLCRAAAISDGYDPDQQNDYWEDYRELILAILSELQECADELKGEGWEGMRYQETYEQQIVGSFKAMIQAIKDEQ